MTRSGLFLIAVASAALIACSSEDSSGGGGAAGTAGAGGAEQDSGTADTGTKTDAGLFHNSEGVPCGELSSNMACEICCAWPTSAAPMAAYLSYVYASCRCAADAPCNAQCKDNYCAGSDATTECKDCPIQSSYACDAQAGEQCRADAVCKPYMECKDTCQPLP